MNTALGALQVRGVCRCRDGFRGAACEERYVVAGHGSCDAGTGACTCSAVAPQDAPVYAGQRWTGAACHLRTCADGCSGHGMCASATGQCACFPGWTGANCARLACANECNFHGRCTLVAATTGSPAAAAAAAVAAGSPSPSTSALPSATAGAAATVAAGNVSVSSGTAADAAAGYAPMCVCDRGWGGADCGTRVCPNGCSGHGLCLEGATCFCKEGWLGDDCGTSTAAGSGAVVVNTTDEAQAGCGGCGGPTRGLCLNATCYCNPGFSGRHCEAAQCPNQCSGHGVCNVGTGLCSCLPGWTSADCNAAAPGGAAPSPTAQPPVPDGSAVPSSSLAPSSAGTSASTPAPTGTYHR